MAFWPVVKRVIREADIVLLVVDSREPELSKNADLDRIIFQEAKELIVVFNKIDLISQQKLNKLMSENPNAVFVCSPKKVGLKKLREKLNYIANGLGFDVVKIGIVGYPNVGKSALVNALTGRHNTTVAQNAGTTKGSQFIKFGNFKIIDSPGVIPFEDTEQKLGLIGAKNPEKVKNPEKLALAIIEKVLKENKKSLEEYSAYSLQGNEDPSDLVEIIGRRKGFLSKGGIVDEKKTSIQVIRDWQKGKLKL